jgi:hypothetical protein
MGYLQSFSGVASQDDFLATLFRPSAAYQHPSDVLKDEDLTLYEKRSILASWASDAWTVDSTPALRAPATLAKPVGIDEILACLRALDEEMRRRCLYGGGDDRP